MSLVIRRPDDSTLRLAVCLAFLAPLTVGGSGLASPKPAPYETKVTYRKNSPIHFADFDLTFLGEHRVTPARYPRGFLVYEFRAAHGRETTTVSWSAGTGDIGPSVFTVAGQRFLLELKRSDRLGVLKENELVIIKAAGSN